MANTSEFIYVITELLQMHFQPWANFNKLIILDIFEKLKVKANLLKLFDLMIKYPRLADAVEPNHDDASQFEDLHHQQH